MYGSYAFYGRKSTKLIKLEHLTVVSCQAPKYTSGDTKAIHNRIQIPVFKEEWKINEFVVDQSGGITKGLCDYLTRKWRTEQSFSM